MNSKCAIVGSGPAGLMAATQLAIKNPGTEIHVFEKRSGLGRKLLIAGSSGLNISHDLPLDEFTRHYQGGTSTYWKKILEDFGPNDWINFIEKDLGLETFLGTSKRFFVKEMKASTLLKKWVAYLESYGVQFHPEKELTDFEETKKSITLTFNSHETMEFDAVGLFLGGGSWEKEEPRWISIFKSKKLSITPLEPSNVGYHVQWKAEFLKEAEGKPLKKITLNTKKGSKTGELVITQYGLEGTPIYFLGTPGPATLDLKPDLSENEILNKLSDVKENFSPIRRVKHYLGLSEATQSLVFHHLEDHCKNDLKKLVHAIKNFPIHLESSRSIEESISSSGGLSLSETNEDLSLKKFPKIFCGGEMLDWDAPTGGFLIQGCVSQGARVGRKLSHMLG